MSCRVCRVTDVRAVFERVLGSAEMANERTAELWNALLEFEYAAGDLASIQKLEKRRAQIFPELGTRREPRVSLCACAVVRVRVRVRWCVCG